MALLSTNSRTAVPQAICVPNSSGRAIRNSRNSGSSSTGAPPQCVLLTAQALCCSFSGRSVSAGQGGCSGRFIPKLSQRAQRSPTAKRTAPWSAGAVNSMEVQAVNCSSEAEPLVGQVSAPARAAGGVIASLLTAVGGLLGSAGSSGRGDIQEGSGGGGAGEGKVGAVKNLLRLGCAIVTPAVGAAASSAEHWWSPYVPGMDDIFASVVTMGAALAFLQIFNELAKRDVLDKKLSRKLVHIGVGLVFMLFWPLFTPSIIAPYLAAFAPGINAIRLLFIGLGWMNDDAVVRSMTRNGDRSELIKGPFYYGVAVVVTTVGFWRTSPIGIVALINLCAGDGFADIVGRNFGRSKLPYNQDKSIAGSVAFFVMSSLVSMLYLWYFSAFGLLKILPGTFLGVVIVSLVTAIVESLPISTLLDDNFTVPFTAIVLGMLVLPVS